MNSLNRKACALIQLVLIAACDRIMPQRQNSSIQLQHTGPVSSDSKHFKKQREGLTKIKTTILSLCHGCKGSRAAKEVAHSIVHLYAAVVMLLQTIVTFLSRVIFDSRP